MNLNKLDQKFLGRESLAEDVQVSRTEGSFVFDARGKKYIDFIAGWCVGNTGWGHAGIRKRGPDYVYPEYLYSIGRQRIGDWIFLRGVCDKLKIEN